MNQKYKNAVFYLGLTTLCLLLMYWIVIFGSNLENGREIVSTKISDNQFHEFLNALFHKVSDPLAILLAQIASIILVARLSGWIFKKIGQPSVIGEIIAGILLGPSLVGLYFPEFSAALFPVNSLSNLQFLSQIGLILFMFVVGMELDLSVIKNKAQDAFIISHVSIIFPFTLGMGLAYFIFESFAPEGIQFISFSLFIGISMSITAFPVLARIVQERQLNTTKLGSLVITCAAVDDITAWCLLAAVIAIVKAGSFVSSIYTIILAILYIIVMIKVVRPFLKRIGDLHSSRESLSKPYVAIFILSLIVSSLVTETIGIHALFGAFMAGAIMPDNPKFRSIFIEKVEDVAVVLLLPLFFVFTGLRTQIGLLNEPHLWYYTFLIILVAVVGKFVGSSIAAKYVGQNWKDSLTIGALMNTRGLMELVVLNIGYDLGILSPEVFAMMVIMALVTTFMTGPALNFINWAFGKKSRAIKSNIVKKSKYSILISFGNPNTGKSLIKLANSLILKSKINSTVSALHLSLVNGLHQYNISQYEKESFLPLVEESKSLNLRFNKIFKASNDIDNDIVEIANKGEHDLLLIGVGQSIFEGSLLGKIIGFTSRIINPENLLNQVTGKDSLFENSPFDERTRMIVKKSKCQVGILVDKDFKKSDKIFIPLFSDEDEFLFDFAQKFVDNSLSELTFLDISGYSDSKLIENEAYKQLVDKTDKIKVISNSMLEKDFLNNQDIMLISIESWKKIVDTKSLWLSNIPSTLILSNNTK